MSLIGFAATTKFTVTCSGWEAFLGNTSDLSYQYSIGYRNTSNTQIFYSGSLSTSPPVTFSVGNSLDSYWSSVYVLVVDSLQDTTLYLLDVQVSVPMYLLWPVYKTQHCIF